MTSSTPSRPAPPAAVCAAAQLSPWLEITPRTAWIAGGIFAAGYLLTFWDFLRNQVVEAVTQPSDWGHTLLIPAISGYFVWLKRDLMLAETFRPSWWGIAIFFVGMSIYMLAAFGPPAVQHHNVRGLGAGIALLGGALAIFGLRSFKYLWFPWAYWLVFGQTISQRLLSRVTERLQDWSAVGADILMNTLGIDVERFGNVLTLHLSDGTSHPLNVAEACSGMRTLMAFLAIGVAMAALGLGTWWQRTALVVAGIPISLFVNILRVTSLGLLSIVDPNMSAGEFHSMVGLVWLVPAFLLFLGAMWIIRNLVVEDQAAGGAP
jgi:exosortase